MHSTKILFPTKQTLINNGHDMPIRPNQHDEKNASVSKNSLSYTNLAGAGRS
jgi:hypothetical protein